MTPIPVTVIGGFLGAGKTTLLNHILRHSGARRLAVLVNDFGSINIDADLVTAHEGDTISLSNGCICCSIGESLAEALFRVTQRSPRPEQIVIEASGVADPGPIAAMAQIDPALRLHGIVIVADAEAIREIAADRYVGDTVRGQLRSADLVVLTKTDLPAPRDKAGVVAWLEDQAPGVPVVEALHGVIRSDVLIDLGAIETPQKSVMALGQFHADAFVSCTYRSDRPFRRDALRGVLDDMPAVIRAKGFALLADDPERPCSVQLVGRRWTLQRHDPWPFAPETRLVLIGMMGIMDSGAVTRKLDSALSDEHRHSVLSAGS